MLVEVLVDICHIDCLLPIKQADDMPFVLACCKLRSPTSRQWFQVTIHFLVFIEVGDGVQGHMSIVLPLEQILDTAIAEFCMNKAHNVPTSVW